MSSKKEPRLERALESLMELLDREVLRALMRTSARALDASVVAQVEEEFLGRPDLNLLKGYEREAREKVEAALRQWLEATNDFIHATGEPGP